MRAFYYSELIRRFGGVIILDHSIDANDYSALTNQPRETFENSVEWVCNELSEAARDLPPVCSASDVGRATDAACYAVMARLRITAASPLFNTDSPVLSDYNTTHYYGNYDKNRWKLAADACRFIMEQRSQYYGLDMTNETGVDPDSWENYYRRFLGRYFIVGKESIWISYEKKEWDYVKIPWLNRSAGGWNWVNPTYELAKEYEMLNGKLPEEPESGYDFNDPGKNRDPRLEVDILHDGEEMYGVTIKVAPLASSGSTGINQHNDATETGYYGQKWLDPSLDPLSDGWNMGKDWVHIRYAEVLLTYAEAKNELQGLDPEAFDAVNQVRRRVGMPELQNTNASLPTYCATQDDLRQRIRNEWRVEFCLEGGKRMWDIRRWGIAKDVLNAPFEGLKYKIVDNPNDPDKKVDGGKMCILHQGDPIILSGSRYSDNNYLFPVPQSEIDLNPALTQNPGY